MYRCLSPSPIHSVLLLILISLSLPSLSAQKLAVVTTASSPSQLLAARTALLSARQNAHLPENTTYLLLTTTDIPSKTASKVAQTDAIHHRQLPTQPQIANGPYRFIPLFDLPYDRLIFLTAFSLVVSPLDHLIKCHFCAVVTKPCAFSTRLIVLTPHPQTHAALQRLAFTLTKPNAICASDPTPEACVLNQHFNLEDSPLFTPNTNLTDTPMRLPPGIAVPHYLYYPRMRWEIPSNHCGQQAVIDFSTPQFARPTNIIMLVLLHLNRQWYTYRAQLHDIPTDHNVHSFVTLFSVCMLAFAVYYQLSRMGSSNRPSTPRVVKWSPAAHHSVIYYWLSICTLANIASWTLSLQASQTYSSIWPSLSVLCTYKIVTTTLAYICLGDLLRAFATHDDVVTDRVSAISSKRAAVRCVALNAVELVVVLLLIVLTNSLPAETGFRRLLWLFLSLAVYAMFMLYVMITLFWKWLGAGANERLL